MQIDLNISITRIVTHLQHKSFVIHTHNSLFITTSAARYKYKVFPDGNFLHDTIKGSSQSITCIPIKPNNMINIKCDMGFCDECT